MKMSINQETTTGVVLKTTPYKENDALVEVYTLDYGRLTFLAKGVKKITSKNASGLQEMTLSEFVFIPSKGICNLIKASGIDFYHHIKDDLKYYVYGSFILEYVLKGTGKNEPNKKIYDTLIKSLEYLNNGYDLYLVYIKYILLMLEYSGMHIEVNECIRCGNTRNIVGISNLGFICSNCFTSKDEKLSVDVLKLFRHIVLVPYEKLDQIEYLRSDLMVILKIINRMLDEYSGIYFNSKKFF